MLDVRKARLSKGWTAKKLSNVAGVSAPYISMIESNTRKPSVQTAKRIAKALGVKWTRFYED